MFFGGTQIGIEAFPNGDIKQFLKYKGEKIYFDEFLRHNKNKWEWKHFINWDNIYKFIECAKNIKEICEIKSTINDFTN